MGWGRVGVESGVGGDGVGMGTGGLGMFVIFVTFSDVFHGFHLFTAAICYFPLFSDISRYILLIPVIFRQLPLFCVMFHNLALLSTHVRSSPSFVAVIFH